MASLAKQIDKVVEKNEDKKAAAVINFTGDPSDEYTEQIKQFAEKNELKNVALTVTQDGGKFKVNDEADVTVMHYLGKKVKYNFAAAKGGLDDKAIKSIVDGTSAILE